MSSSLGLSRNQFSVAVPMDTASLYDDNDHQLSVREMHLNDIADTFSQDGFVILSRVLPTPLLSEWQRFAEQYFRQCLQVLHQMGHTTAAWSQFLSPSGNIGECKFGLGAKHGFREIVMRSPGRFELSLLNVDAVRFERVSNDTVTIPNTEPILQLLDPVLLGLLGKREGSLDTSLATASRSSKENATTRGCLKLCHLSLLIATPDATDQGWHADGGHLSVSTHLPCHCYNVFIPLVDVPLDMGPTEFRPGGHVLTRNLAPMMLAAKCRKTLRKPVWPSLKFGDAVLFDYRVLHRGRANRSDRNRNMLVFTFCEPWFEDVLNFPKRSMLDASDQDSSDDEEQQQDANREK